MRIFIFMVVFIGLLLGLEGLKYLFRRGYYRNPLVETMENKGETADSGCVALDKSALESVAKNTKRINTLRETISKMNLKELKTKIESVNNLIDANTDDLKEIADESRKSANQSINMNVKGGGDVYDEDGKLIYKEKQK